MDLEENGQRANKWRAGQELRWEPQAGSLGTGQRWNRDPQAGGLGWTGTDQVTSGEHQDNKHVCACVCVNTNKP